MKPGFAQVFEYRGMIEDELTEAGRRYKEVQVGDFNEDGWPDIYAGQKQGEFSSPDFNKDRVYVHRQSRSLADLSQVFEVMDQPPEFNNLITDRGYDVEVGDFDGDGHEDLIRPDAGGRIDVLWGDGMGQFFPASIVSVANDPNGVGNYDDAAIGDLDADGDQDVLVAHLGQGFNLLLRNLDKEGSPRQFSIETLGPALHTHTVSVGHFDRDGILDVVLARSGGNSELLRNDTPASDPPASDLVFELHRTLELPDSVSDPTTVADFVDLDRDGLPDVYVARVVLNDPLVGSEAQHFVYFQGPPGVFTSKAVPRGLGDPSVYDARYADLDLDGSLEIVRVNIHNDANGSTLQAVRVDPDETFTDVTEEFFGGIWRGEMGIELADLDRDGDLDLILAGSSDNSGDLSLGHAALHVYENLTNPPVAHDDFITVPSDLVGSLGIPVGSILGNDNGWPLWWEVSSQPFFGTLEEHALGVNYTPNAEFWDVCVDSFRYEISDSPSSGGNTDTAVVFLQCEAGTPRQPIFDDVPLSHWTNPWVEGLFLNRITTGCSASPRMYCPASSVSRIQMAAFLVRSLHGPDFVPPAPTGIFDDVPVADPFAPAIEQLFHDGITKGCSTNPPLYCPADVVTREQMAAFIVRSVHGPHFVPLIATGIFDDVSLSNIFAPSIEQLYRDGVTSGCGTNPLRYCPKSSVRRDHMAVFLMRAFNMNRPF